jgi:hypothetical protein
MRPVVLHRWEPCVLYGRALPTILARDDAVNQLELVNLSPSSVLVPRAELVVSSDPVTRPVRVPLAVPEILRAGEQVVLFGPEHLNHLRIGDRPPFGEYDTQLFLEVEDSFQAVAGAVTFDLLIDEAGPYFTKASQVAP